MAAIESGVLDLTDDDRQYSGSRFADVADALFANSYQSIWGAPGEAPLPVHPVTLRSLSRGLLPTGNLLRAASERTLDSRADLRWGQDRKGFRRLLHPNGICLVGRWEISEPTLYTGYFAGGSTALAIGRYSTCCTETRRGHTRSLALVGKLFPTIDAAHPTPLETANFITQEDIGGASTEYVNDAELRNAPDTTASMRGGALPILLTTGLVFNSVDRQPSIRQLYPIAELGKPAALPTQAPEFLRLPVDERQPRIPGDELDFRDEIMAQIFDPGDPVPKRTLTFAIEVSDDGETHGTALKQQRTIRNWRRIGSLVFDTAVVSYNGDFVLHFAHPTWRTNRNDPSTATRVEGRKVR
jgi:hypothetical protein